jgi:D-arabinose 1-dehydrogenase-like Zn-dependent alcohol dehydrogenase
MHLADELPYAAARLPHENCVTRLMSVMAKHGRIYPLTVSFEAPSLPLLPLVVAGLSIVGSAGCYRYEMQTMMDFAAQHGVRPQIQKWPMTQQSVTDTIQTLKDGKMKYRGVVEV